ncbi:MAG: hypothetical protein J7L12_03885 [Desulfurococcales archaeon]|nr:hypothetical protein [Desulfurococcales archaeon]
MAEEVINGLVEEVAGGPRDVSADGAGEDVWPCNCPLCRVFIKPVFRVLSRVAGARGVEEGSEAVAHEGVEGIEEMEGVEEKVESMRKFAEQAKKAGIEVKAVKAEGEEAEEKPEAGEGSEEKPAAPETPPVDISKLPQVTSILERVEALEEEVQSLKNSVAKTIEGIKATLVDLRAAVAEVSNPFNIMRKYAELLGFGAQQLQGPQPQMQQLSQIPAQVTAPSAGGTMLVAAQPPASEKEESEGVEKIEKELSKTDVLGEEEGSGGSLEEVLSSALGEASGEKGEEKKEEGSNSGRSESIEDILSSVSSPSEENKGKHEEVEEVEEYPQEVTLQSLVMSKSAKKIGLGRLIKLVKWVDAMLERMPEDSFEEIIKFATNIGLLNKDDMDLVLKAVALVLKSRQVGVRIDDQLIALYMLAKIFGVEDKEADSEIVKLAVNKDDLLDKFIKP